MKREEREVTSLLSYTLVRGQQRVTMSQKLNKKGGDEEKGVGGRKNKKTKQTGH